MLQGQNKDQYILIVEDSFIDLEITTRALRKAGMTQSVHHCKNGDEALDFLTKENDERDAKGYPGMILLDLNLPGIDGRDVLEEIKNHNAIKDIPVVILTTSNNEQDIKICYEKGANSYVKKPTMPDDYVEMASALKQFWFDWATLPEKNLTP